MTTFTSDQLHRRTSRTSHLSTFSRSQLNAMNDRTDRDIPEWKAATDLNRRIFTRPNRITSVQALWRNNVTALAVCIENQSNMSRTIRIIFQPLDLARNAI